MTHHLSGTEVLPPDEIREKLEKRLGRFHARQRLGIEVDHEAQIFGQGLKFFNFENLPFSHQIIETVLKLSVRRNEVASGRIPTAFGGFAILHLSDLHADMSEPAIARVIERLPHLNYDICVLTGDYRGKTFGPFDACLAGVARLRAAIKDPVYGVLGNHDTIRMVPALEGMGIRMLLNECTVIEREEERIHLAGIDDAHFYRVDNIEKAASSIPHDEFSILLSHTPEIYSQAAHAGFGLLLAGHTHGGQICLPGGIPIMLDLVLQRAVGAGAWKYAQMAGYTAVGIGSSVVPVRFNCPPEITLHYLRPAKSAASYGLSRILRA